MTRRVAYGLGVVGLVVYGILRVTVQHRPALPAVVGAALGVVVLALLARGPRR